MIPPYDFDIVRLRDADDYQPVEQEDKPSRDGGNPPRDRLTHEHCKQNDDRDYHSEHPLISSRAGEVS